MGCVPFDPDYSCSETWPDLTPDLQDRATDLAWATLRVLTGGQIGNCLAVVRPCLASPCTPCASWWQHDLAPWVSAGIVDGDWVNCACGTPRCSCAPMCEILMPGPVAAIAEVSLSGCQLNLDLFRVDNGYRIVRQDGNCWPSCQYMNRPLGAPGTLGITYLPGILPDSSALWAAGVLADEFSKACSGAKCRLPASVTTIARQGVSMTMASGMFEGNLTGIREVDAYVLSVNPNGLRLPPMVWSPDAPWTKHRYQTATARITP